MIFLYSATPKTIIVFTICFSVLLLTVHELFPHPLKSIISIIRILKKELGLKNIVEIINVFGIIIFAFLFLILIIAYYSHSVLFILLNSPNSEHNQFSTTLLIFAIALFGLIILSPLLIKILQKESDLIKRANEMT